jgi:hypothetical protein
VPAVAGEQLAAAFVPVAAVHRGLVRTWILAGCSLAIACGDPSVDRPDVGIFDSDAGVKPPPDPPMVTAPPARQPYALISIRGTARSRRVLIEPQGGNTISTPVLSADGTFCADYPLSAPGSYTFVAYALDERLSAPSASFSVAYDPSAPPIPGAQTCSGADPAGCGTIEICDNGRDDNCDQRIDLADPRCQPCQDDLLEPNDVLAAATRLVEGREEPLRICSGDDDWYLVAARAGETFTIKTEFTHAEGNLELALYALDRRTVIARGNSIDDDELLTHTATASGEYPLRIYGDADNANAYALELDFVR